MSVYSMTGFAHVGGPRSPGAIDEADHAPAPGAAARARQEPSVAVEARSVNGRFLDVSLRLPDELRGLEPALRDLVAAAVRRGKVELRVSLAREADTGLPSPRPDQLSRLAAIENSVRNWLPGANGFSVHEALQWCRSSAPAAVPAEAVVETAREAIAGLRAARAQEGARLVAVMRERVDGLRALADRAEPLVPFAVARQRERFVERWNEALAASGHAGAASNEAIADRALAEAVAYAVRIDVAEELSRLRSHLDAIDGLLTQGGEIGKRLEFLIQELQREANTLGSKSTSLELTGISVDMKVLVEQLRVQVQTLE